jgi:hypothetical protein
VYQSHTSRLTELWSLPRPAQGLNTYNKNDNGHESDGWKVGTVTVVLLICIVMYIQDMNLITVPLIMWFEVMPLFQ